MQPSGKQILALLIDLYAKQVGVKAKYSIETKNT